MIALKYEIGRKYQQSNRLITSISKNVTDPADYSFVWRYCRTAN